MLSKLSCRVLTGVITIPVMLGLAACNGQDVKKSEPVKPAVTDSQSVKDETAAKEKAQAEANAKQEAEAKAKAEAAAKAQAQATPAPQKPAVKQAQKPAVQQARRPAAPAPARRAQQKPARQYLAPAKPAPQKPAKTNSGYKLKPGEVWIDKNNMDKDGSITLGGDEDGNVW